MSEYQILNTLMGNGKVLGLPPKFHTLTDPSRRVTTRHLAYNAPIVTILPGRPEYGEVDADEIARRQREELDKANRDYGKDSAEIAEAQERGEGKILQEIYEKLLDRGDSRYFHFAPDIGAYLASLRALHGRVITRMGQSVFGNNDLGEMTSGWGGLNLWMSNSSSVSESASTEYGDSMLQAFTDQVSDKSREIQQMLSNLRRGFFARTADTAKERAERDREALETEAGMVEGFFGGLSSTIRGAKMLIPKIWKNSEFSRTYSVAFKFQTPYGDKDSILREVFTPFLCLLPLVLPRQAHSHGYEEPFLVKVDCPGWFFVECGVVTSMSINKAPENHHWNKDGLPTAIEVGLEIMDLYPAIMLSFGVNTLNENTSLAAYIDTLAGIGYRSKGKYGTIAQDLKEGAYRALSWPGAVWSEVKSDATRSVEEITIDSIKKIFFD